jgi:hypothetical protein
VFIPQLTCPDPGAYDPPKDRMGKSSTKVLRKVCPRRRAERKKPGHALRVLIPRDAKGNAVR